MKLTPFLPRRLRSSLSFLITGSLAVQSWAATTVLLDDPMDDLSAWIDLSQAVSWTGAPVSGTAFESASGVLTMNTEALSNASMWGSDGIRSFSAIDFPFPEAVHHATNTLTIEFRMRWESVSAKGESNRVAFMLLHDYPAAGVDITTDQIVGDFTHEWFGRPAYQVRVRGGFNPPDAAPYIMYGGGLDAEGEFETQKDNGQPLYWLPGFVSAPGGTSPGTNPIYNYPENGWSMGSTAPASTTYKRYRYIVEANKQSLWVDADDDGAGYVNILEMPLPFEVDAPTNPAPPLYNYFETFDALRIYFRSAGTKGGIANQVYLDNVKITVDGDYGPSLIAMNNANGDYLETAERDSDLTEYRFSEQIKQYRPEVPVTGLRYVGGQPIESAARVSITNLFGCPIVGAIGPGTKVHYRGSMDGDGGQSFTHVVLQNGGHWVMEAEADLNLILDGSLFTRQLWVYGDGTGILEFAEGFVSDHTQNGTVGDGIAAVRLSNNTLLTHHTQSLPVAPRPDGSGGLQINGHMVFENVGGSTWITRTNPQTYTGAVWIGVDATIQTDTDLTHAGITQFSSHDGSYWATNAFQTTASNVRVEKTGAANLIFSEETAFLPGSVLAVLDGGVHFLKNPADGFLKASPTTKAGPELNLLTEAGGHVEVDTSLVEMASFEQIVGSELILEVQPDGTLPLIQLTGDATLAGTIILRNSGGYALPEEDADVLIAGGFAAVGGLAFINETAGDFDLSQSGDRVTISPAGTFLGRDPKFFYYQSDGRFIYLGMGDAYAAGTEVPLVDWSFNAPVPDWQDPQPGGVGSWTVDYSAGAASWEDGTNMGVHGRYHIATFPPGLSEADFGDVSFTFNTGDSGTVPVMVIRRGVVINEDWSDGAFDAPGWDMVNDPDIGFFNTGRTDPEFALARVLDDFIWPVAYYHTDHFAAGPEDILVIRMTSFSDVAFTSAEFAKPEVAALHDNPDHEFNHDHAAELSRHYYTLNGSSQLRPSVDNQEVSLSSMHHAGGSTAATLENKETATGIFRTVDTGTQVETFGEINKTQVLISGKYMMEDNFIQISIPRSYDAGRGPVHRGNDPANLLVGISHAHVGVTSRTDANLDYATDAYDFMYLNSYYGDTGTDLPSGDLDNDGETGASDLSLLAAEFGRVHNPGGRIGSVAPTALDELPGSGTAPQIGFNETTGELLLIPSVASPIAAIVVESGPVAVSHVQDLVWSGDWRAAVMADGLHWIDASRLGVTEAVVLATYAPGTLVGDFGPVVVGYADGGVETVAVTSTTLDPDPIEVFALHNLPVDFEIRFGTQTGYTYQLQASLALESGWSDFGSAIVGNGTTYPVAIPTPPAGTGNYYRIVVTRNP